MQRYRLFLAVTAWLAIGCQPSGADGVRGGEKAITNGADDDGHPHVGLLLVGYRLGTAESICTGTLVGPRTVLTSTHCLKDETDNFFRLGGRLHPVEAFIRRDDWVRSNSIHANDIGLALLAEATTNVPLAPLAERNVKGGEGVTLVGFGVTASGLEVPDAGTKRVATNTVDAVGEKDFTISGSGGDEGNICAGDSGGPAFATIDGREVVVGVASATQEPCGQTSWYVAVAAYRNWLSAMSQGDLVLGDGGLLDLGPEGGAIAGDGGTTSDLEGRPGSGGGCRLTPGGGVGAVGLGLLLLLALALRRQL